MKKHFTLLILTLIYIKSWGQIALYDQFLGKYDFTMIGNTLNTAENGLGAPCTILTQSSASLNLSAGQEIEAAYLYWAGSGSLSQADLNVRLNGANITAQRTFTTTIGGANLPVFGAFADVTSILQATGNSTYTLSDLDLTSIIYPYCYENDGGGTNFGGWSIVVVYKDDTLTNNLVNIYDGFARVDANVNSVNINLENLNVLHLVGNKIGFLAWEGDSAIANGEKLLINENEVSNPPLNPATNAFNSTNSFTNPPSTNLWNMDLDYYYINDYTSVGDNELRIRLESMQDAVIINNITLVLNSEVPDATIKGTATSEVCDSREVLVNYTVENLIATDNLPAGTPIAFYANTTLIGTATTQNIIPIGGTENGTITLTVPNTVPSAFNLVMKVDDDGTGQSTVIEFNENNNTFEIPIILGITPTVNPHDLTLEMCDSDNNQTEQFNLSQIGNQMLGTQTDVLIRYYTNEAAAIAGDNTNITNTGAYISGGETIYVRMEDVVGCFIVTSFEIKVIPATPLSHEIPVMYECAPSQILTGISFNLRNNEAAILNGNNPSDFTISFHLNNDDALTGSNAIPNPTNYENISSPQNIWVRVVDLDNCVQWGSFELIALPVGEFTYPLPALENCSTNQTLTGIPTDLTENRDAILNGNDPDLFTITYHLSEEGAINNTELIEIPENYSNVSAPQTVWARMVSAQGCVQYGSFELIYHAAPIAQNAYIEECSMYGPAQFDLNALIEWVVEDSTGLNFKFYLTENDAQNDLNPLPYLYTPSSENAVIYVRVINEFGCFTVVEAQLVTIINTEVIEEIYYECDEPFESNDGFTSFNLTTMNDQVNLQLGLSQTTISFHLTALDAATGTNPISNPTDYTNISNPQILYARAMNMDGHCGGVAEFTIEVLPVPEFELPEYLAFCNYDDKKYTYPKPFDTYTWYDSNGNPISNQSTVTFPSEGIYTLEVTSADFSCPASREVEVIFDNQPTITDIEVNGNTIKIYANGGTPPYQYSYNNGLSWGNDYIIHNIPGGIYDLIVKSKYGCISTAKTFGVLGIANLITPNGDGRNDNWEIKGLEAYPDAHIKIFDRYGKVFVDRPLNTSFRWDGHYLGRPVPSGDYWYIITVEEGRSISGHISVRYRN